MIIREIDQNNYYYNGQKEFSIKNNETDNTDCTQQNNYILYK